MVFQRLFMVRLLITGLSLLVIKSALGHSGHQTRAALWSCARKVEIASSRLLSKISALEGSRAIEPYDVISGGFAGDPAGRLEDSGTRRSPLSVLRAGRPGQFRERPRDARRFRCSAGSQRKEGSEQSGSLLHAL